jgi:Zn-dependent peptidase ImmA (M78 family)
VTPGERAEALIHQLGISAPGDLDVEAIAYDSGVLVTYADLQGCDATLVGFGHRGIATIRPSTQERERFSVAHELGHWSEHRGRSFTCRVDDVDANLTADKRLEREADQYAAHLLMPRQIFAPHLRGVTMPTFRHVRELARAFNTSILATCLRLAEINAFPLIVASYGRAGLRWQIRSRDVPRRWGLKQQTHQDSFAYELLQRGIACDGPRKQPADVWFDNDDADKYEITEECIPAHGRTILALLSVANEGMLTAGFDRDLWSGNSGQR